MPIGVPTATAIALMTTLPKMALARPPSIIGAGVSMVKTRER